MIWTNAALKSHAAASQRKMDRPAQLKIDRFPRQGQRVATGSHPSCTLGYGRWENAALEAAIKGCDRDHLAGGRRGSFANSVTRNPSESERLHVHAGTCSSVHSGRRPPKLQIMLVASPRNHHYPQDFSSPSELSALPQPSASPPD